jgi:hypothetical protein
MVYKKQKNCWTIDQDGVSVVVGRAVMLEQDSREGCGRQTPRIAAVATSDVVTGMKRSVGLA